MLSMNADAALRKHFIPRADDDHLFLRRESARDGGGRPRGGRSLNNGVGWIQVLRPRRQSDIGFSAPTSLLGPHDGLSSARGISLGIALGISAWGLVGGLIGILFL